MINRMEVCVIFDHMVNGHQHLARNGDDRFLVAAALFQRLIFLIEIRILFCAFDSGKGTLHKQRFEVMPAIPNPCGFLLIGACVVCGREPGLGSKAGAVPPDRHVGTDFSENV